MRQPRQITIGGEMAKEIWKEKLVPLLKGKMSCRELAPIVGVSHMMISNWRKCLKEK